MDKNSASTPDFSHQGESAGASEYEAPVVIDLGSFSDLTRGVAVAGNPENGSSGMSSV